MRRWEGRTHWSWGSQDFPQQEDFRYELGTVLWSIYESGKRQRFDYRKFTYNFMHVIYNRLLLDRMKKYFCRGISKMNWSVEVRATKKILPQSKVLSRPRMKCCFLHTLLDMGVQITCNTMYLMKIMLTNAFGKQRCSFKGLRKWLVPISNSSWFSILVANRSRFLGTK